MQHKTIFKLIIICALSACIFYLFRLPLLCYSVLLFIVIAGCIYKPFANGVLLMWYKIGNVLGCVNSKIILTVLYLGIITPYAFIYRWFGKSDYQSKLSKTDTSLFKQRDFEFNKTDFEKSW